jgi:hypothetical protein
MGDSFLYSYSLFSGVKPTNAIGFWYNGIIPYMKNDFTICGCAARKKRPGELKKDNSFGTIE